MSIANMSIAVLLSAAEFLERREREAEHGYASTLPPDDLKNVIKRPKTKKSQGSRTTHNELEKNRRAHLRNCLEKLKELVPLGQETSRHTTLGLLTKAKRYIKSLEQSERRAAQQKEQLQRVNRSLKRKVDSLSSNSTATGGTAMNAAKRRSVSECSISSTHSSLSSTASSIPLSSPSSLSECDEVDVIGYTSSGQSDTDDHSSEQSISSDSGVALSTSRLSLSTPVAFMDYTPSL